MSVKRKYRLAVFSDSHGNYKAIERKLDEINACDYFVFLGDGNRDVERLSDKITAQIVRVAGNCDLMPGLPSEIVLTVGNAGFLIVHGHTYGAKNGLSRLSLRARELNCGYVLYGHTHRAGVEEMGGITLINPGASCYGGISCAIIEGDGEFFSARICENSDN